MASVTVDHAPRLTSLSPGAGCACKLPLAKLEALFASLDDAPAMGPAAGDLLVGAAEGDDAAVLRLDDERALVLTTDFFTPIVDDPGDWGRIAAANALSDVYAMGGRPLFAVNLAAWPGEGLDLALLAQVMRGGAEIAAQAGCFVAGGHTIDDPVPKYGLAVTGLAHPDAADDHRPRRPRRPAHPDQGHRHRRGRHRAQARRRVRRGDRGRRGVHDPAQRGRQPGRAGRRGARGHRRDRLRAARPPAPDAGREQSRGPPVRRRRSRCSPAPPNWPPRASSPVAPGPTPNACAASPSLHPGVPAEVGVLLHDAQTSGGLLLAVAPAAAPALLGELRDQGLPAAIIGEVTPGEAGHIQVEPDRSA